MGKGLIDILLDSIFDADYIGRRGEKLTEKQLKWVQFFGRDGKVLRNIYVPKKNGETTEIDLVFITQKGIFVIESKNYSGWIFGDENSANWTAALPSGQKNRFYNPIKQNSTHMKWLAKLIGEQIPLFSLIVFSERCELKKVPKGTDTLRVIKRDRIQGNVRDIWNHQPDVLKAEEVQALYDKLEPYTNVDQATKDAHVERINQKYNKDKLKNKKEDKGEDRAGVAVEEPSVDTPVDESTQVTEDTQEAQPVQRLCPRCGAELVLREAKKGKNAGGQFYGCSAFPKCRYIKGLDLD